LAERPIGVRLVRAGRLLNLLLILQNGRRITAGELAKRLEVSERTVLRDIEVLSGAGVPVYAIRGPQGGFALLDTVGPRLPPLPAGLSTGRGRLRRVRVRLAPEALQLALVVGKPEGWRRRPNAEPHAERPDWREGSFRFDSYESAVNELLALGANVEVLMPAELRATMAEIGRCITRLHQPAEAPTVRMVQAGDPDAG
jgi:predicted DNA-binding transcriptional regulator YafY